mmetsp:Transcript_9531/g.20744  ORF Transcript_9531/g.20744 Transcript_9531/m.20744 type:complete len:312 (+) Transcript_9531:83-1018(+)
MPCSQTKPLARKTPGNSFCAHISNFIMSKGFVARYTKLEKRLCRWSWSWLFLWLWLLWWSWSWSWSLSWSRLCSSCLALFSGGLGSSIGFRFGLSNLFPSRTCRSMLPCTDSKMTGDIPSCSQAFKRACFASFKASSERRSTLLSRIKSACLSCLFASKLAPKSLSEIVVASETQMTLSRCTLSMSSICCSVARTGSGSQTPEVSMITTSIVERLFFKRAANFPARSSLISQQTQPFVRETTRSSSTWPFMRAPSTSMLPYSLTNTAARNPSLFLKMWFTKVVFPAPRKPVMRQIGIPGRSADNLVKSDAV